MVKPLREWLERNPDAERPSIEEAEQIVHDLLTGEDFCADLSELPPMSKDFLPSQWGLIREHFPRRAGEALRNWIAASETNPVYWDSLKVVSARLLRDREPLPDALRVWLADMLEGNLARPKGRPGKRWYANDNRNMWIGYAVGMLLHLGMTATRTTRAPENKDMREESACDAVSNYLCSRELDLSYEDRGQRLEVPSRRRWSSAAALGGLGETGSSPGEGPVSCYENSPGNVHHKTA